MTAAAAARKPSLKTRLLRHVLLPLAGTWALGAIVGTLIANHFVQQAFDRSLLDDAYLLSSHITGTASGVELDLSKSELQAVLFDQSETMYFAILHEDGELIAGQSGLRAAPIRGAAGHAFSDLLYRGRALRAVTLRRDRPPGVDVVVAQTDTARSQLLSRLLLLSIVPQLALLALVTWWLRRAIRDDLQPLADLQQALDQRDANDLSPMAPALTQEANSRDVERLGGAVDALLLRIAQGLHQQREFAGNVAHELRTPLAGIRALTSYGLAHAEPAVWREQLQAIADSEDRASHLIDQLLAIALADESRGLQLEQLALDDVVRDTVLRVWPRAEQAGVDLGASGLDGPVPVRANRALVEGLLNNLLDNAMRYGRPAEGRPTITVEVEQHADHVVMAVSDNGPGLPASARTGLLSRWAQGDAGWQLGQGAGLGFAIVARFAALMNARFSLEDAQQGSGLRAVIRFSTVA